MGGEYTPNTEAVREQYTQEQPPQIGTISEKGAEFDRWIAEERRKAKAQGWDHAMTHVEMWIKFNLGKDTLFEFEDDDHLNPYEDKLAGEDDE